MRRALAAAAVLALLVQAPQARAALPVVAWCVSSPGEVDTCSAVKERILATVEKRMATAEEWELGGQLTITRVQ